MIKIKIEKTIEFTCFDCDFSTNDGYLICKKDNRVVEKNYSCEDLTIENEHIRKIIERLEVR